MLLCCANVRSIEIIDSLETLTGKPVVKIVARLLFGRPLEYLGLIQQLQDSALYSWIIDYKSARGPRDGVVCIR